MSEGTSRTALAALGASASMRGRVARCHRRVARWWVGLAALACLGVPLASAAPADRGEPHDPVQRAQAAEASDAARANGALPDIPSALFEPDPDVVPITVLASLDASPERVLPVGAFCPARPSDPIREASTFGLTALLMWALARRRTRSLAV